MWISNTATAAMMLSIAHAVLQELKGRLDEAQLTGAVETGETPFSPLTQAAASSEQGLGGASPDDTSVARTEVATSFSHSVDSASGGSHLEGVLPSGGSHLEGVLPSEGSHLATTSETRVAARNGPRGSLVASDGTFDRLCKGLMLGVTYSANIGGIGTLTGTGPNLLLRENAVRLAMCSQRRERGGGMERGGEVARKSATLIVLMYCCSLIIVYCLTELRISYANVVVFGLNLELACYICDSTNVTSLVKCPPM